MAIPRPKFQPGHTAPDDPLLPLLGPGHTLIGRSTFPTHQQLRQGIFAGIFSLLRLAVLLHHFPLAGAEQGDEKFAGFRQGVDVVLKALFQVNY